MQLPESNILQPEPDKTLTSDGTKTEAEVQMTDVELEKNVSAVVEALTGAMQNEKIQEWCKKERQVPVVNHEEMQVIPNEAPRHRDYHIFFVWKPESNQLIMNIGRDNSSVVNYYLLNKNGHIENSWRPEDSQSVKDNEVLLYLVKTGKLTPKLIQKLIALKERTTPVDRRKERDSEAVRFYEGLERDLTALNGQFDLLDFGLKHDPYLQNPSQRVERRPNVIYAMLIQAEHAQLALGNIEEKLLKAEQLRLVETPDPELSIYSQHTINNPILFIQHAKERYSETKELLIRFEEKIKQEIDRGLEQFMQDLWSMAGDGLNESSNLNTIIPVIKDIRSDNRQALNSFRIIEYLAKLRPPEITSQLEFEISRLAHIRKVLSEDRYEWGELLESLTDLESLHVLIFSEVDASLVRSMRGWIKQIMNAKNRATADISLKRLPERFGFRNKVTKLVDDKFAQQSEMPISWGGRLRIAINEKLAPVKDGLPQLPSRRRFPPQSQLPKPPSDRL